MNKIPFFQDASSVEWHIGKDVGVYRNLHRDSFSVIDRKKRIVLFHTKNIVLRSAIFHVRKGGWQSVVDTGVKNVHAFVYGSIARAEESEESDLCPVTYRPKLSPYFHTKTEDSIINKILKSSYVKLINGRVIMAKIDCESK